MKRTISRKNLWDGTPRLLKSALGSVLQFLPLNWLLGSVFRANSAFVHGAQWWPVERAVEYQVSRLRELLKHAYDNTKYYHRMFDSLGFCPGDIQTLDCMNQLPTIDKDVVIENRSDMCARNVNAGDMESVVTAGTGGTPLSFLINAERSAMEYSYLVAGWERAGFRLEAPTAVLRGRTVRTEQGRFPHEYDPIFRQHYYSSFHMSDENLERYLEHIAAIGSRYLHVYPSTVTALARFILRSGVNAPESIEGILAESEIVYPEQRKLVEEIFGCRYLSSYGQTEKVVLAAGCEHSNDYHVWPTYGYFELLDDDGNPVTTPGEQGEIVGTGFINTVMPFIRYRTGDWATYVGDRCEACGREHTLIRDIRGHRTQEVLIAVDGSEISWTALNMHDDTFARVRQFQFLQEERGQAVLRVVPTRGFGEHDVDRIQRNLGRKLDNQLAFTIELTDAIPLSARGKAIYVDQRIQREVDAPSNSGEDI